MFEERGGASVSGLGEERKRGDVEKRERDEARSWTSCWICDRRRGLGVASLDTGSEKLQKARIAVNEGSLGGIVS